MEDNQSLQVPVKCLAKCCYYFVVLIVTQIFNKYLLSSLHCPICPMSNTVPNRNGQNAGPTVSCCSAGYQTIIQAMIFPLQFYLFLINLFLMHMVSFLLSKRNKD